MKKILSLIGIVGVTAFSFGQDDCGSAVTVTDLSGTICATSAPSNTDALAAGPCEEGSLDTWFQFTAQGPNADITVSSTENGFRPEFLVVSGTPASTCAGFTTEGCFDLTGNYTGIIGTQTGLTIGETYWIVVSSNGDDTGGTLTVCVDNPAVNPACVDNQDCSTPATLTLNAVDGGAACVNDCNTGASAGPDFAGANCFDLPNSTVWYEITTGATAATLDVSLTSGSDLSDPEYTIFSTTDCATYTIVDCVEGTGGSASNTGITIAPSTTYLIAVSDATGDEGDFQLCVTQNTVVVTSCTDNEDCSSAATITLNASTSGTQSCITDCNTGASAGLNFTGSGCEDQPNAAVWYTFTTDALAATIDIDINSADLSDPEYTLFLGNACVSPWTILDCEEGTGGSLNGTGIPVQAETTSAISSGPTISRSNFFSSS